jgi:hypothetical protein
MRNKTIALAGAGIVAAPTLALGGAALASADETGSTATSTSGTHGQLGEGTGNGNTDPSSRCAPTRSCSRVTPPPR